MTVLDEVLAFLKRNAPEPFCDDCIARKFPRPLGKTHGNARRHANRKTVKLQKNGDCLSDKGTCGECKREKKVSWVPSYKTLIRMPTEKQLPDRPPPKAVATQRPKVPPARNAKLPATALCLVSCVSRKQPHRAPARDLYISDWFAKVRELVEAQGWPWFILSAKHGLVHPDDEVAPYEKTLNTMRVAERRAWASDVMQALECHLGGVQTVVVFAGQRYREFLVPEMRKRGVQVEVPMERLKIGEQLARLNHWIKP